MDDKTLSKEEIALQLTLAILEKDRPLYKDFTADSIGKAIAALYNAMYENLKI